MARGRTAPRMNELTRSEQARLNALARMLPNAADASPDQLSHLVCALLDAAGISKDRRLDVLGGAFVTEAFRPHWDTPADPPAAHKALRESDPELAEAVEALAVALLGRAESREMGLAALSEVERLLAGG